jgi:hypothetical protein
MLSLTFRPLRARGQPWVYPNNYGVLMRSYHERLFVPVTWWFLGAVIVAILGAELWAGFGAVAALVTYAVLLLGCGGTLLHWGSASIRVTDGELEAAGHQLPRDAIGDVVPLDERHARAVRGEHADPAAHTLIRPYLKRAVYIEVIDPAQAAPYWLVGTRRPDELATALRRCSR